MEPFSGALGLVCIPSMPLCNAARQLASELAPSSAVAVQNPNIILYYGHLKDLPAHEVEEVLEAMGQVIVGTNLFMGQVRERGGRILVWQAQSDPKLRLAHLLAVHALSKYRAREGLARAEHCQMELTPEEMGGIERDGYPFTRSGWTPEIRLAWHRAGFVDFRESFRDMRSVRSLPGAVASIQLVRFEELGDVKLPPLMATKSSW